MVRTMTNNLERLRRFGKDEDGQALVLVCTGLVMLMLIAGLGVDVGYLRYQHEQMQKAADAGALAGASEYIYDSTKVTQAAQHESAANGFTDGSNGITVTVLNPPTTAPFDSAGYVQVTVAQAQPNFFMRVAGFNTTAVSATAVGSALGQASGCIYALDPSSSESFLVNGNVSVDTTCGIRVESDNSTAMVENGNSGIIQATGGADIGVVGTNPGYTGNNFHPTPVTNIANFSDPLANQAPPTFTDNCPNNSKGTQISGNANLSPGVYCGGIQITGNGTVNFASGLYVMVGGGMTSSGNATLISASGGMTVYNTYDQHNQYGPISIIGTATTSMVAPTTASGGDIAGVLFFQDRTADPKQATLWNTLNGTAGSTFTGIMYFPTTNLDYSGNTTTAQYQDIIAWDIKFDGNSSVNSYGSL